VRLRHWYLTSRLGRRASPSDAQHSLTVLVENVPLRYRSRVALQRKFDRLCGPGSVDSVHVMVGGLEHLNGLVGRRDRARAKLEDARSRRARLAALREGDYRARASLGTGAAPRERPSAVWFERFLHRQASAPRTADAAPETPRAAAPWPDPESAARSPPPSPAAPARATSWISRVLAFPALDGEPPAPARNQPPVRDVPTKL